MALDRLFRRYHEEEGGDGAEGSGAAGGALIPDPGGDGGAGDPGGAGDSGAGEGGETWLYAEGVEGTGDRPPWFLADKYKSVEEQARAYPEAAAKLGGFTGAPEGDYELTMPEGIEGEIAKDDPLLEGFQKIAKEEGMSQDAFTKMLHHYIAEEAKGIQTSRDNEISLLGDKGPARVKALGDWGAANLEPEKFQALRRVATTAEAVEVLEDLIQMTRKGRLPDGDGASASGVDAEKLKEMKFAKDEKTGRLKTEVDPEYRKQVRKAYRDFYGNDPKHEYVGGRR